MQSRSATLSGMPRLGVRVSYARRSEGFLACGRGERAVYIAVWDAFCELFSFLFVLGPRFKMLDLGNPSHPIREYGYVPTEWVCIIFITCFGLSTLLHITQSIYSKLWFLLPTAVLAGVAEVIGWSGRLWSSQNPTALTPYIIQITTTIIAPTPLLAAYFVILGTLIKRIGSEYSRIGSNLYTIIFCSADIIALIVQAIGGGKAAIAVENRRNPEMGGNIMLGGIVFQMISIVVYVSLAVEFLYRVVWKKPLRSHQHAHVHSGDANDEIDSPSPSMLERTHTDSKKVADPKSNIKSESGGSINTDISKMLDRNTKLMLVGLAFSTFVIFVRSVYRTIELSNGFAGPIIHNQQLFNFLDGMMIVLAMFCLNILHPGWLLSQS